MVLSLPCNSLPKSMDSLDQHYRYLSAKSSLIIIHYFHASRAIHSFPSRGLSTCTLPSYCKTRTVVCVDEGATVDDKLSSDLRIITLYEGSCVFHVCKPGYMYASCLSCIASSYRCTRDPASLPRGRTYKQGHLTDK